MSEATRQAIDHFELGTDRAFADHRVRTVPLARLMPEWVADRQDVLEGETFTLFRLPRGIDHWRRRVRRDIRHFRAQNSRRGAVHSRASAFATGAE